MGGTCFFPIYVWQLTPGAMPLVPWQHPEASPGPAVWDVRRGERQGHSGRVASGGPSGACSRYPRTVLLPHACLDELASAQPPSALSLACAPRDEFFFRPLCFILRCPHLASWYDRPRPALDPAVSRHVVWAASLSCSLCLQYLSTAEYAIREELTLKIAVLAEKFAPNLRW